MATKLGSVVPSHLVDAVTDHIPDHLPHLHDHLPELPDFSLDMGDVSGRLRTISDAAGPVMGNIAGTAGSVVGNLTDGASSVVGNLTDGASSVVRDVGARMGRPAPRPRRMLAFGLPALLVAVAGVGLWAYLRSRRSSRAGAPAGASAGSLTHAS